jgi:uncharacterized protein YbaR (Trm112 family)
MLWCPNCKEEYREGFTHCGDCDAELVRELTERQPEARSTIAGPPDKQNLVSVYEAYGAERFWLLDVLDDAGIPYFIEMGIAMSGYRYRKEMQTVYVDQQVKADVERYIAEYEDVSSIDHPEDYGGDSLPQVICPACGQTFDMDYPLCPFCGAAMGEG